MQLQLRLLSRGAHYDLVQVQGNGSVIICRSLPVSLTHRMELGDLDLHLLYSFLFKCFILKSKKEKRKKEYGIIYYINVNISYITKRRVNRGHWVFNYCFVIIFKSFSKDKKRIRITINQQFMGITAKHTAIDFINKSVIITLRERKAVLSW